MFRLNYGINKNLPYITIKTNSERVFSKYAIKIVCNFRTLALDNYDHQLLCNCSEERQLKMGQRTTEISRFTAYWRWRSSLYMAAIGKSSQREIVWKREKT